MPRNTALELDMTSELAHRAGPQSWEALASDKNLGWPIPAGVRDSAVFLEQGMESLGHARHRPLGARWQRLE
jgi:hypothetical protein